MSSTKYFEKVILFERHWIPACAGMTEVNNSGAPLWGAHKKIKAG
jgi:hypothetical protein